MITQSKTGDSVRKLLEATGSHLGQAVLKRVSMLNRILAEGMDQGKNPAYLDKITQEGRQAIKADIFELVRLEKERNQSEVKCLSDTWIKDFERQRTQYRDEIQDAERRYSAMSEMELRKEANKYLEQPGTEPTLPGIVDALSVELKKNGLQEEFESVRKVAQDRRYNEPWFQLPEGRELLKEQTAIENCRPGDFPIAFMENGKRVFVNISLEDVLEPEGEEADDEDI